MVDSERAGGGASAHEIGSDRAEQECSCKDAGTNEIIVQGLTEIMMKAEDHLFYTCKGRSRFRLQVSFRIKTGQDAQQLSGIGPTLAKRINGILREAGRLTEVSSAAQHFSSINVSNAELCE